MWKVLVSPEFIKLSLYGRKVLVSPELIRLSLYGGRCLSLQSSSDCPSMVEGPFLSRALSECLYMVGIALSLQNSSDCLCMVECPCLSRAHQNVSVWWKVPVSSELSRLSLYAGRSLSLQSSSDRPCMVEDPCLSSAHQTVFVWLSSVSTEILWWSLYSETLSCHLRSHEVDPVRWT